MIKLKHFYKVIFLAVLMAAVPAAAISQDLAEGLVAHWTFDNDTGGKVFDFSGNRNHGTSYNVSYGDGPVGKAAVFNNAGASIHIPQKGMPPSHKIADLNYGSISLWFKYQSVGANILPILYFGESDDQSPHNSLIIEIGHSEDPRNRRLYFTIVNKQFCFDSRQNLEENKWYHFAAVVSPDGNTGYLNGELMSERNYNLGSDSTYTDFFSSVPAAEMLSIGYGRYGRNENFFTFKGSIDDVRIYNKPLRPDEVKNLYEMGEIDEGILPDFEDISYGPHERNLIDFWKADSDIPTPVVVFIHGGGFINGDKSSIRTSGRDLIRECLDTGISFAAINYRLRNTTTLDSILLDCSRSIQFLRFKAEEWNINKDRIAAYGGSAGGGASLWISASDDLADPNSEEAVLRESSRLTCAGHLTSQATYDIMKWADFLDIPEDWITEMNMRDHFDFYGIKDQSEINDPGVVEIRERVDMLRMIDKNDPRYISRI